MRDEDLPVCYRCFSDNPIINRDGDQCSSCRHPFQRSFVDFRILPLVEFELEEDITDAEAAKLISTDPRSVVKTAGGNGGNTMDLDESNGAQTLQMDDYGGDEDEQTTPFATRMHMYQQRLDGTFPPILVDRKILQSMHPSETFVRHYPGGPYRYYANVTPEDLPVVSCEKCQHFFLQDSYEFSVLKHSKCPYCRFKVSYASETALDESMDAEVPSMY